MAEVEREHPTAIAVVEAALLLEAGAKKDFDKVIVVTCDAACKAQRYAQDWLTVGSCPCRGRTS